MLPAHRCHAADDARTAAERHDRDRRRRANPEYRLHLIVIGRVDDGIGRTIGSTGTQANQVGIALAGGVQYAFAVINVHILCTHYALELRDRRGVQPAHRQCHGAKSNRRARALGDAYVLAQEGERMLG
jgi:hypothetical protein